MPKRKVCSFETALKLEENRRRAVFKNLDGPLRCFCPPTVTFSTDRIRQFRLAHSNRSATISLQQMLRQIENEILWLVFIKRMISGILQSIHFSFPYFRSVLPYYPEKCTLQYFQMVSLGRPLSTLNWAQQHQAHWHNIIYKRQWTPEKTGRLDALRILEEPQVIFICAFAALSFFLVNDMRFLKFQKDMRNHGRLQETNRQLALRSLILASKCQVNLACSSRTQDHVCAIFVARKKFSPNFLQNVFQLDLKKSTDVKCREVHRKLVGHVWKPVVA